MSLSILSLNIWNYEGPWAERLALIRHWIRLLDPDLIGFQEVLNGESYDQAQELFDGFDYHLEFAAMMPYWGDNTLDIGNLAASRWAVTDKEVIVLPQGGKADRRVLLAIEVDSPYGEISFNTTHLIAGAHQGWIRERQIKVVGETVIRRRQRAGLPLILCGDFNARPESSEIRYLTGLESIDQTSLYLNDAWLTAGDGTPGATFTQRNNHLRRLPIGDQRRFDYMMIGEPRKDGAGRIESCHVVCDTPVNGIYPSDHFGVYVELALP